MAEVRSPRTVARSAHLPGAPMPRPVSAMTPVQGSVPRPYSCRAMDTDNADDGLDVAVTGLRKEYGAYTAVNDLDLQVGRGEIFALLGPNGAGKTTTVEILVGVRRRTSGSVRVLGEDPARDSRAWRNRIGVVPQNTAEYLDLTVREIVDHFASFYANPLRSDELLDMVGLTSKAKAYAPSLSGGQKRRLDVAVGVVGRPELIFLDEPTTGLDPEARRKAWHLVEYFRELGATTVLTTHYLDEAEALADRAGIIVGGSMLQMGKIEELRARAGGGTSITFTSIGDARTAVPQALGTVEATTAADGAGTTTTVTTSQPTEALTRLISWAHSLGHSELDGLSVRRPTLEDTYLRLVQQRDELTKVPA